MKKNKVRIKKRYLVTIVAEGGNRNTAEHHCIMLAGSIENLMLFSGKNYGAVVRKISPLDRKSIACLGSEVME